MHRRYTLKLLKKKVVFQALARVHNCFRHKRHLANIIRLKGSDIVVTQPHVLWCVSVKFSLITRIIVIAALLCVFVIKVGNGKVTAEALSLEPSRYLS